MVEMKASPDRILVVLDEPEVESPGGILIPELAQKNPTTGTVLSVGGHVKDTSIVEGAYVLFDPYAGAMVDEKRKIVSMWEADITAIVG